MPDITKSGVIVHDPKVCTGCGICGLICSLYHEKVQSPTLARSHIIRQPFTANHVHYVCEQCSSPECYFVCPLKDTAIYIEAETGTVKINESECIGCEECVRACPFDPPRIMISMEKKVAYKCDLCGGREGGPICVEYCPFQAIKLKAKAERR